MMTLLDYAQDVGLSVEEVMDLCDKIGISYQDENSNLDEECIILLDNEMQDREDYVQDSSESDSIDEEERRFEEEVEDKAELLAYDTNIDLDDTTSFTRVKPKQSKNVENTKKDFFKERKKIYKHREKLQSNESIKDENVILFKEGMTVSDMAQLLNVQAVELVKKLIGLGVMAAINQPIDYDSAEIIVSEYYKVLRKTKSR